MSISTSRVLKFGLTEVAEFGKYRLIAKLGQGGMADVFLAVARGPVGFTKLVVIKRLKPDIGADREFHGMFVDEARLAARLNHPNVVQTNEVGDVDGQLFLCMEYLEGQPLNRIVHRLTQRKKQALPECLRVVSDALAGLHYAHGLADYDGTPLCVVHRDVSPHNVFVTYDGVAKVVDFGIAKATVRSQHTGTGVVKGKISYMAPEQAVTIPLDRRADIFSMGVILWELVAGQRLWGDMTEVQILHELAFGEVPRPSQRKPDVAPELDAICARALAMTADNRYPTAAAFREDLEAYMKESGQSVSTAEVGTFLTDLFKDRREEVKSVIQDQLAAMEANAEARPRDISIPEIGVTGSEIAVAAAQLEGAIPAPPPSKARRPAGPRAPSSSTSDPTPSASGIIATGDSALIAARPRRNAPLFVVGGVLAAAAGLLLFVFGRSTAPTAPPEVRAPVPVVSPPPVPPATGQPTGGHPMIEVRIEAVPRSATIYLDDAPVSVNPFTARFSGDGTGHRIRAEAPGHKPMSRLVVFDQDRVVDLKLEPEAPGTAASTAGPAQPPPTGRPAGAPIRRVPKVDTSDPWK